MTPEEKEKSLRLRKLVQQYEDSTDEDKRLEVFHLINKVCEVSEFKLNQYWEACSLEEFCDSLAVEVVHGVSFSKERAIPVIKEMCSLLPENVDRFLYLHSKYGDAIEYVFRNSQYIWLAIYAEGKKFNEVMSDLNSSEGGPISL